MIGSVDPLLTVIEEKWPAFLLQTHCNRQQRDYINQLHSHSTDKTFVAAQVFSMNYTLIHQRGVQQDHF